MKEIRILHLFPKLLSLYGEYGNVAVLAGELRKLGHRVEVSTYEDGQLSLENVGMVYVGSGTEENLKEALRRLQPNFEVLLTAIQNGVQFLATGNALALFGKELDFDGSVIPTAGAFAYTTAMDSKKRYLGDALGEDAQGRVYVGFINTGCVYTGMEHAPIQLLLNPKLGNDKQSACDGIEVGSFFGTQLIGPVLTKNPHLLGKFITALTGDVWQTEPESNLAKAYEIAKKELLNRLNA